MSAGAWSWIAAEREARERGYRLIQWTPEQRRVLDILVAAMCECRVFISALPRGLLPPEVEGDRTDWLWYRDAAAAAGVAIPANAVLIAGTHYAVPGTRS